MFKIEDEIHAELQKEEYATYNQANAELKKISKIPWDQEPNKCPCMSWRTCERKYQIVEYDDSKIPWTELDRKDVVSISAKGVIWKTK